MHKKLFSIQNNVVPDNTLALLDIENINVHLAKSAEALNNFAVKIDHSLIKSNPKEIIEALLEAAKAELGSLAEYNEILNTEITKYKKRSENEMDVAVQNKDDTISFLEIDKKISYDKLTEMARNKDTKEAHSYIENKVKEIVCKRYGVNEMAELYKNILVNKKDMDAFIKSTKLFIISTNNVRNAQKDYDRHKQHIENVENLLQGNIISTTVRWEYSVIIFMLRQEKYGEVLAYCQHNNKLSDSQKTELLSFFDDAQLSQLILKYRICQDWKMHNLAAETLRIIEAKDPRYVKKDLILDYLKHKIFPLDEVYEALQAPHMAMLIQRKPEFLTEEAEKIAVELKLTQAGGLENFLLEIISVNENENNQVADEYSIDATVFEADILPEIGGKSSISLAQINSKHPLAKFIREITARYDNKDTLHIEFLCGIRVIEAKLDLRSMKMSDLSLNGSKISAKEAEREIINILRGFLFEAGIKSRHSLANTANENTYQTEIRRIFKEKGASLRSRKIMQREYQAGAIKNIYISEEFFKDGRNPFEDVLYFRIISRNAKDKDIAEPLYDMTKEEAYARVKNGEKIAVLGYAKYTLRGLKEGENPRKEAVKQFAAHHLRFQGKPWDEEAVDDYLYQVIGEKNAEGFIDKNLNLIKAGYRVKEAGDKMLEYKNQKSTFVHGYFIICYLNQ